MSELPKGWSQIKLSNIATLRTGPFGSSLHQSDYVTDGVPLINPMHIVGGQLIPSPDTTVSVDTAERLSEFRLKSSDIVIGRRGEMGRCAVVRPQAEGWLCGTGSLIIRPLHERLSSDFLQYFLAHDRVVGYLMSASVGSTMANLNQQLLLDLDVCLPPAEEQIRIVAKLEELQSDLDAGVAELKAAQKKLQQYRQSLLKAAVEGALTASWRETQRAANTPLETGAELLKRILRERRARWEEKQLAKFKEQGKNPSKDWQKKYPEPEQPDTTGLPDLPEGWVWASIEQVSSDERYSLAIGPFGSNLKVPDYRDAGVPLVFVRNIRSGNYGGAHTKYVTPEKARELWAHSIAAGDVLVTKMGEPPGDADVYPSDQPPAVITADCIKIRCWPGLMEPQFLKAAINSYIGKRQIEPMTQGVAQKKVSLGRFTSLAVPLPPVDEQALIVQRVAVADREACEQLAAINFSLKQSAAQRKNILRAAFAGELVPQDPNNESADVLLERIRTKRAEREKQPKARKTKQQKEIAAVVSQLIDVLAEAGDWMPAQEAFLRCGVADGALTERIEELYAELRELDKAGRLAVEAVTDAQGRKLYDKLKLLAG